MKNTLTTTVLMRRGQLSGQTSRQGWEGKEKERKVDNDEKWRVGMGDKIEVTEESFVIMRR